MTALKRPVRRAAAGYVVILHPGETPLVEVREKGRRKGFAVPVANLYVMLAVRDADRSRAAKRKIKRGRLS